MMKYLSMHEAFRRKFERQKKIKELKYDALGTCVHIGKLSPGCIPCFDRLSDRTNFYTGAECNLRCVYCNTDSVPPGKSIPFKKRLRAEKNDLLKRFKAGNYNPSVFSFSGGGEPLLHFDFISNMTKFILQLCKRLKKRPWFYLYTNGALADNDMLLKLKELGFDEIRFHLGATNFSPLVYKHIAAAVKCFKEVTVETPAWPPHRKQLFKMLPRIDDIGVKHLNLGELELSKYNIGRILRALPNAQIYPCFEGHLDDAGLAYDIIREVIRKKYSYSVLDCNCFVKLIQRGKAMWLCGDPEGIS